MVRRAVAVGFVLLIAISTVVVGVGAAVTGTTVGSRSSAPAAPPTFAPTDGRAATDATTGGATAPDIAVAATHEEASGVVTYRLSVTGLDRTDHFALVVGTHGTVTRTEGFERRQAASGTRLVASANRTSGTVVVTADAAPSASGGPEYVATDDWGLTRVPYAVARWSVAGSNETRSVRPLGDAYGALRDDATATYGDRYALVGEQTGRIYDAPGQRIRIVRPTGTKLTAGSGRIAATLRAASDRLRVGDRDERLTMLAVTDPVRRGGESFPSRDEAWVRAESPVNSPNNVWVHEYVHTRQDFQLADDMQWFREASAEYYAARLTYEQGRISRREMVHHLDGPGIGSPLTDPEAWTDDRVPYTKGARVLALLDRNIRQSTNGERSLQDVFRRMNAHDGPVTYAQFKEMVAATAGHSMDGWLDRYVDGRHAVASAYGLQPDRSGVLGVVHAVIAGDRAVRTTLIVATLLGAFLSMPVYAALRRLYHRYPFAGLGRRVVR